ELRRALGNRIYGCDDCQLVCPWNRFAKTGDTALKAQSELTGARLVDLFAWSEADFNARFSGSPIRRIGYECWLRNVAVALGNAGDAPEIRAALAARADDSSALVREHVRWALDSREEARPTLRELGNGEVGNVFGTGVENDAPQRL
ncbi:MAG: hypothetical protein LBM17_06000, partial [Candidatus Accumulibacter sp.]|nr:hypothetical protein [Accumulibacter sp.]